MKIPFQLLLAALGAGGGGLLNAAQIVQAEYYLGTDPGPGNGTAVALPEVSNLAASLQSASIPLALSPGTHDLGVRVKDDAGRWSNASIRRVTILPGTYQVPPPGPEVPPLGKTQVAAAEVFFGSDPGPGLGQAVSLAEAELLGSSVEAVNIALAGLVPGTHQVGLRVRDAAGHWSHPILRRYTLAPGDFQVPAESAPPPVEQEQRQLWTLGVGGSAPGPFYQLVIGGQAIAIESSPGESAASFLSRLAREIQGNPRLSPLVEIRQPAGAVLELVATAPGSLAADWVSGSDNFQIALVTEGKLGAAGRKITTAEYFVDLDPGAGNGIPLAITAEAAANGAYWDTVSHSLAALKAGNHRVGVRFRNAADRWGQPIFRGFTSFTIDAPDVTPPVIQLTGGTPVELAYGQPFAEPGWTATDNADGNLTATVVVDGQVNVLLPGDQQLSYTVVDQSGNRTQVVRVVRVSYPDYESWVARMAAGRNPEAALLLPGADADHDGQPNRMEWRSNTDPFDAGSKLQLTFEFSGTELRFRWCGKDGIKYRVEASPELDSWVPFTAETTADEGPYFEVRDSLTPESPATRFFRLVSEPR